MESDNIYGFFCPFAKGLRLQSEAIQKWSKSANMLLHDFRAVRYFSRVILNAGDF